MSLEITRYKKAHAKADYKNRTVFVNTNGASVYAVQEQDTEQVKRASVTLDQHKKLFWATDLHEDGKVLIFSFGDVDIKMTAEQLDEIIANRPDVNGKNYMDISAK